MRHVRKFLGTRVRDLRQRHGWSQGALGERCGLSGKFIGEVERGEKSISVDSLYRVSVALEVPLRELVEVPGGPAPSPPPDAEALLSTLGGCKTPEDLRRAYEALRAYFNER